MSLMPKPQELHLRRQPQNARKRVVRAQWKKVNCKVVPIKDFEAAATNAIKANFFKAIKVPRLAKPLQALSHDWLNIYQLNLSSFNINGC
ncbi:hypothetical protein L3X38_037073 [Prunus dulcis]|uniref:Uncharacterized protein n=1 Tax=Prunus dulcis TaxID=3755 RepID=A0AAD4V3X9_PRUDU|nr:hypothetical protein L3X38_037073 [Prunus dulcis]